MIFYLWREFSCLSFPCATWTFCNRGNAVLMLFLFEVYSCLWNKYKLMNRSVLFCKSWIFIVYRKNCIRFSKFFRWINKSSVLGNLKVYVRSPLGGRSHTGEVFDRLAFVQNFFREKINEINWFRMIFSVKLIVRITLLCGEERPGFAYLLLYTALRLEVLLPHHRFSAS